MRLPAVAIALAFASGIAFGLCPPLMALQTSLRFLPLAFTLAAALIVLGLWLLRRSVVAAGAVSLAAWLILGASGIAITRQPQPDNYVLSVVDAGTIDLHTSLRWHGTFRDEPKALPWGVALDVNLTSVDFAERSVPLRGGLRLSYSDHAGAEGIPEVHAGDEISAVAQARLPQVFRDEGAFDRRAYLRDQGIDLTASLRAPELLERTATAPPTARTWLARTRRHLREELSSFLPGAPQESALLRAMLLGDRSFVDREESVTFQKTGVFHVLVVAGLHVGAFSAFLFWLARKLRLSRLWTSFAVLCCVVAYVAVVEQRPPVLRAALMTLAVVLALLFFRRVELLNSVALAALTLLVASAALLTDSSFQLSFLAMFSIAGLAVPWLEKNLEPYAKGLRGWRDVTRDVSHPPRVAQFRIDLRGVAVWAEDKLPSSFGKAFTTGAARIFSVFLRVAEMLVLTMVLQIGMLPMLARDFHRVSLSGPLANLLAVPLTAVLVPLGFAVLLAGFISLRLGTLLAVPLRWLAACLIHAMAWIAHFPLSNYRIPAPPVWLLVCFFAAAVFLAVALRNSSGRAFWFKRVGLSAVVAAALLIAVYPFAPRVHRGWLELNVLDVGQGDSLFLVSPAGHTLLVDAAGPFTDPYHKSETRGADPGEDAVSPYLWSRGFQQIDIVALTHAHQDHLGGLPAILENFRVNNLWIGREVELPQQRQLEALAILHGTKVLHELRGDHLDWDGTQLDFLWPQIVPQEVAPSAKNDDSLVFHIAYGQRSFLLPGDAEKAAERAILSESSPQELRADILKIGHHGSKNSTTPEFLDAVQPKLAVISAGEENPYGHPNPALLDRLEQAGIPTLRTDKNGAIHIATDGKQIQVSCFVSCSQIQAALQLPDAQPPDTHQNDQQE
ncbi:MAG TPA: DNA internalization-related competence protein ComEC/Rec2 [Candidatus Acidoferrum sp.]|nr:DNA internalization-related competence protein ComEC/Rec2 [Candidatus Acidoferrum sp.]